MNDARTAFAELRAGKGITVQPGHAMRAIRKRIEDTIGLDELYDIERRTVENG